MSKNIPRTLAERVAQASCLLTLGFKTENCATTTAPLRGRENSLAQVSKISIFLLQKLRPRKWNSHGKKFWCPWEFHFRGRKLCCSKSFSFHLQGPFGGSAENWCKT